VGLGAVYPLLHVAGMARLLIAEQKSGPLLRNATTERGSRRLVHLG